VKEVKKAAMSERNSGGLFFLYQWFVKEVNE